MDRESSTAGKYLYSRYLLCINGRASQYYNSHGAVVSFLMVAYVYIQYHIRKHILRERNKEENSNCVCMSVKVK